MTKKEFLKLPVWREIPDDAEILGSVFSIVKHTDDRGNERKIKRKGMYETDADTRLLYSSHVISDGKGVRS